jgi:hypothetical protein
MAMSRFVKLEEKASVRKIRRIPTQGDVLVAKGDVVEPETVLARGTVVNPDIREVKVYARLRVDPEQVARHMLKEEGDQVKKDEVIAIARSFFGRFTKVCRSPMEGTIEVFSKRAGRVLIRGKPIPVEIRAHIPGRITEIIPEEGAIVETQASIVRGVFGVGGEVHGELVFAVENPGEPLTTEVLSSDQEGRVLVGGSFTTLDAMRKAAKIGVGGIITGGVDQKDLTEFLGGEIGMGVTGGESGVTTLIITEGFGIYPMNQETFRLLKSYEGRKVSIDGTTQIRQRMLRPEVIIPL